MNAIEILADHRRHLIQRLVSRSPLLKFLPGALREDICELFKDITPDTPALTKDSREDAVTTPESMLRYLLKPNPQPAAILNPAKSAVAKCRKIRQQGEEYRHNTGQNSLYIGYPLIFTPIERKRFLLAPLFLWPVSCHVAMRKISFNRLKDEDSGTLDAQFNRIFQAWLKREEGIQLKWNNEEEDVTYDNLTEQVRRILQHWSECEKNFDPDVTDSLSSSPKNYFLTLTHPQVLSSAVIGHGPFKGQALLDDLDQLKSQLQQDPENCGVLKYFLFPRNSNPDPQAGEPAENAKWLANDSDHSQESAIWQARESCLTVLQGPPGTGKSQTIVNLIADALAQKKNVLVVCQKRAALDVIKKRLDGVNLGDLVELIDDPSADRYRIIKAIRAIEDDKNYLLIEEPAREKQRKVISNQLSSSEELLDNYTVAMNDTGNDKRPRYGDLMARLHSLKQHGIHVFGDLSSFYSQFLNEEEVPPDTLETLRKKRAEIESFIEIYERCSYDRNPWRELKKDISIMGSDIMEIEALLEAMVRRARILEASAKRCVHSEKSAWLAEHSWLTEHYLVFLPDKLRQDQQHFQELAIQTRQLSNWLLEKSIRELLDHARHSQSIAEHYQNFFDSTNGIPDICHIHQQISQNRLLHLFSSNYPRRINDWSEIFEAAVFQTWLKEVENHNKSAFIGTQKIKNQQKTLKKLFYEKRRADIEAVRSHFTSRVYHRNKLKELGLLRQKRSKYASKTSLRQLYSRGFEDIHGIYPVLLTNPETASAILELISDLYDMVIIDEASQMFMADAMPILYRARTVVISGDEMQMPPSNFFMLNMGDDDTDSDVDDDKEKPADQNRLIAAEGEYCLLDAAEQAIQRGSPNEKRLLVHYRSECKELIDFSNHAFYDGKLIVPSGNKILPSFLSAPIELHPIAGIFSSGINEIEARAVVEKVKGIWQVDRSLSMGVIAFNIRQRDKIEELLAEESQGNTHFGQMIDQERNRTTDEGEDIGFFVRSVEHVQGDERDIIILSTTYSGETRNFGPISKKEKGRRRLNVAITRAKCGMIVISSLNIDHISNESEQNTRERYYFWKYMCYVRAIDQGDRETASHILRSLNQETQASVVGAEPESPFEEQVAEFLTKEGFHVDYQVGESGFRIDLGLKQQQKDPLYICGIECDGRQYHSGWKARMNDIWRQKILESKGWKIVRIWSSDWFGNPEHAQRTLISQIENQ